MPELRRLVSLFAEHDKQGVEFVAVDINQGPDGATLNGIQEAIKEGTCCCNKCAFNSDCFLQIPSTSISQTFWAHPQWFSALQTVWNLSFNSAGIIIDKLYV